MMLISSETLGDICKITGFSFFMRKIKAHQQHSPFNLISVKDLQYFTVFLQYYYDKKGLSLH